MRYHIRPSREKDRFGADIPHLHFAQPGIVWSTIEQYSCLGIGRSCMDNGLAVLCEYFLERSFIEIHLINHFSEILLNIVSNQYYD